MKKIVGVRMICQRQGCRKELRIDNTTEYCRQHSNSIHAKRAYKKNSDKIKANSKKYRQNNLEKVKAYDRTEERLAKKRAYTKANPEVTRSYNATRRALTKGAKADLRASEWREILSESRGLCLYCGDKASIMEHIVPLSPRVFALRGKHTKNNVAPACKPCNDEKSDQDPLIFLFKKRGILCPTI